MNPDVAIVVVNWDKKDCTLNLLASLQNIYYDNYEIIIIDNASTDGSSEAIQKNFPAIHLIKNSVNLGGTGGFNTGICHALKYNRYKYIWLLDNDAEVEGDTLKELVTIMEEDMRIGIAGSRIVDIKNKDITIEAGGFFSWDAIEVVPFLRNEKDIIIKEKVLDVDYVAICSALVRTDSLKKVGLMDERYFIFWDDMDWGLQFKKNKFRVVSVLTSVAYHPPFTEKRSLFVDFYYGYRNSLLVYAKHAKFLRLFVLYFNNLRYRSKVLVFFGLTGRHDLMSIGFSAIFDFIRGLWGRKYSSKAVQKESCCDLHSLKGIKKIIFLNTGNKEEIYTALTQMKHVFPNASYDLLMFNDRADMFHDGFQKVIPLKREKQRNYFYLLSVFTGIFFSNYDLAVVPQYPSPFAFAAKMVYLFNSSEEAFNESSICRKNIWKLFLSIVLGEALSILLLPVVYIRGLFYCKRDENGRRCHKDCLDSTDG